MRTVAPTKSAAQTQAAAKAPPLHAREQGSLAREETDMGEVAGLFGTAPLLAGGPPDDADSGGRGGMPDGFVNRLVAAREGGGRTLGGEVRAEFEPRFGRSLSHVRLHDGAEANALNREISARAFTFGNDIFFACGGPESATRAARRLLAHEITHTLQRGGAEIKRAEEDDGEADQPEVKPLPASDFHVFTEATSVHDVPPNVVINQVEHASGPHFAGDLINLGLHYEVAGEDGNYETFPVPGEIRHTLNGQDLELVEDVGGGNFIFRVVATEAEIGSGKTSTIDFTGDIFAEPVTVTITLEPLPASVDVRDPQGVALDDEVERLKKDKRDKRRARGTERRAHRAERKAHRDETREQLDALREHQKNEGDVEGNDRKSRRKARQALRRARRNDLNKLKDTQKAEERGSKEAFREARRGLTKAEEERDLYDEESTFDRGNQVLLQEAASIAAERAGAALSAVSVVPLPGADIGAALAEYFKITPKGSNGDEVKATLQQIKDVLNLARTGLFIADYRQFQTSDDCDDETGAYVSTTARHQTVTVCDRWIEGNVKFGVCSGPKECRAFALLHEFVHTAGIKYTGSLKCRGAKEVYTHCNEWEQVTPPEALTLADAYAAFAWRLGGGS